MDAIVRELVSKLIATRGGTEGLSYKQLESVARAAIFILASVWETETKGSSYFMQRALELLQDLVGTDAMIAVMTHDWEPELKIAKRHCEEMEARTGVKSLTSME